MTSLTASQITPQSPARVRCSLIVLNFDGYDVLAPCLESLLSATTPDDEVIVVDNGSKDSSLEVVSKAFPAVRLLPLPTNRYIFGLNDGLKLARGEYVAFCNNDMTVEPGFVNEALPLFNADDVFAVCPRVLDRHGSEQGTRTAVLWKHGLLFFEPLPHSDIPTHCFFA